MDPRELVWYCPECGHIGSNTQDPDACCPDNNSAWKLPRQLAMQAQRACLAEVERGRRAARLYQHQCPYHGKHPTLTQKERDGSYSRMDCGQLGWICPACRQNRADDRQARQEAAMNDLVATIREAHRPPEIGVGCPTCRSIPCRCQLPGGPIGGA